MLDEADAKARFGPYAVKAKMNESADRSASYIRIRVEVLRLKFHFSALRSVMYIS